mmetsp:Transcript_34971/g.34000  ORF Transcript_34971/g.34000 Transcript_34971/m.34000 type:complete len:107 (+) Transcript_34971:181-501(+)
MSHYRVIPYLMSHLRNKETQTHEFRYYSDRIMRLLIEEAISHEPMVITKKLSPTGVYYDHLELQFNGSEYCAIPIMRSGDAMINDIFNLVPGITIGKVLIQRDEST